MRTHLTLPLAIISAFLYCLPALAFQAAPGRPSAPRVQPTGPATPGPDPEEAALAAIQAAAATGDITAVRPYLGNSDINIQAAAFDALVASNSSEAITDLLGVVNDAGAAGRLQALQILQNSALADDRTMSNALRGATGANDNAVSDYAAQELARRDAPDTTIPTLNATPGEQFSAEKADNQPPAPEPAGDGSDAQSQQASAPNSDPASAEDTKAAQDSKPAIDDLIARFRDTSLPAADRLQALQQIDGSNAEEWNIISVLREAITDAEPSLRAWAVQAAVRRGNAGSAPAMDAAREAMHSGDRSTRLLVVKSLGHTDAAMPLLREAAADSDKEVSAAATAVLDSAPAEPAPAQHDPAPQQQ